MPLPAKKFDLSALRHFELIGLLGDLSLITLPMLINLLDYESRIVFSTESKEELNVNLNDRRRVLSQDQNSNNDFFLLKASIFTKAKIFSPIAWLSYLNTVVQYPATVAMVKVTENCHPWVRTLFHVLVTLPPAIIKFLLDPLVSPIRNMTAIRDFIQHITTVAPAANVESNTTEPDVSSLEDAAGPAPAAV